MNSPQTIYWVEKKANPFTPWVRISVPFWSEKEAKERTSLVEWDSSGFSVEIRRVPETISDSKRWQEICDIWARSRSKHFV